MKTKKAFITGATSGIGEEFARLLASQGVDLLLTGRNYGKLLDLKKELQVSVEVREADLDERNSVIQLAKWASGHGADLWVNNAGFGLYGSLLDLSDLEISQMLTVNCEAVVLLTREAIRHFRETGKKGTILNIASVAASVPFPFVSLYGGTKAFVKHFSLSMDAEVNDEGIRVLASCPGVVETNFQERAARGISSDRGFLTISVQKAAKALLDQVEKGEAVKVFDWKFKLFEWIGSSSLFRGFVGPFLKKQIRSRILRKEIG